MDWLQFVAWLWSAIADEFRSYGNTMCIHRRQYRDEDELHTMTINVMDVIKVVCELLFESMLTSKEE